MLSSDTIDVRKMTAFCLRFSLPNLLRPLVWKVLLTVLPPHRENHDFVYRMRCQQFDQLAGCLRLLDLVVDDDPTKKSLSFLQMYLLEEGKLGFRESPVLNQRENRIFLRIAETMTEIYDDDMDAFFASICFFKICQSRYDDAHHLLPDCMLKLLRQADGDD